MTIVALQGLHGGVGTTSTAAALGWALHRLGKRVLVVDATPDDQLAMHFNLPLSERGGGPAHVWRAEPGKGRRGVMRKGSIFFPSAPSRPINCPC